MDEKKYSQLYQALLQEVLQFHNGNQRRIRKGMRPTSLPWSTSTMKCRTRSRRSPKKRWSWTS